jgi:uncharacterized membrane protein YgaE (UPF0421/DUF939 family)
MEIDKILNIVQNAENKSNKDLFEVKNVLEDEHEKTKTLIINLTRHLESIENLYVKIDKEITKRTKVE